VHHVVAVTNVHHLWQATSTDTAWQRQHKPRLSTSLPATRVNMFTLRLTGRLVITLASTWPQQLPYRLPCPQVSHANLRLAVLKAP
jgi:hypothetical protein